MTERPYTDTDLDLAARAEYEHDATGIDGRCAIPWDDTGEFVRRTYRDRAHAGLDALARAGRLKPPTTDAQIRAGADALVRLRTPAPSLSELDKEEQAFWRRDAAAVLDAAGPLPGPGRCGHRAPNLLAGTIPATCALTAGHAGWHRGDGSVWGEQPPAGPCPCTCHQPDRCPCKPGAPAHRHGAGGYCTVPDPAYAAGDAPGATTQDLMRLAERHTAHAVTVTDDGGWEISHPDDCTVATPTGPALICLVHDLAVEQLADAQLPPGRYEVAANDVGDKLCIFDCLDGPVPPAGRGCRCEDPADRLYEHAPGTGRVCGQHDDECTPPNCTACGCWCHGAEQPAVTVERPDDEHIEIHVNGEVVASANYDGHGWSGMDAVERTALAVARAFGARIADNRVDQAEG